MRMLIGLWLTVALLALAGGLRAEDPTWTVEVGTTRPTSLSQVEFQLGAARVALSGAEADHPEEIATIAAGTYWLNTTLGKFKFTVGPAGVETIPSDAPLAISTTATGFRLLVDNDLDFPDFAVRLRNPTGLTKVHLEPLLEGYGGGQIAAAASLGTRVIVAGEDAEEEQVFPLEGMVRGSYIYLSTHLGTPIWLEIGETEGGGVLTVDEDVTLIPLSLTGSSNQVLVIENTVDVPDFAVRVDRPTTLTRVDYWVTSWYGPWFRAKTGSTITDNRASRVGLDAETDPCTFDLSGLAPRQRLQLRTTVGAWALVVSGDGVLELDSGSEDISLTGDLCVIDNWVDFPGFRIRHVNDVNTETLNYYVRAYGVYGVDLYRGIYSTGDDADIGATLPVMGLRPGMYFSGGTDVHGAFLHVTDDGKLVLESPDQSGPQYGEEISVDADGDVTLVLPNPLDVWCRLYLDSEPAISTYTLCRIKLNSQSLLNGTPRYGDPSDIVDGEYFHLGWVGPRTGILAGFTCGGQGGSGYGVILFNMRPDGTAAFAAGVEQVDAKLGRIPLKVDGQMVYYYVELVPPPNEPPTVAIDGENLAILTSEQDDTAITASVSDPEGDDLVVKWFVDGVLVLEAEVSGEEASLALADLDPLVAGDHVIRVEVIDGMFTASDEIVVTVANSPPVVAATGAGTYEIGGSIVLSGSVSDYDGDDLEWKWLLADERVVASGTVETTGEGEPVDLPESTVATGDLGVGVHSLTLFVDDKESEPVEVVIEVRIIDTTAPALAPVADTRLLWPPNHEMVDVLVEANACDASGGTVTLEVEVLSSEPPEFDGAGSFLPDYEVVSVDSETGEIALHLRAERSGKGDGRIYTIVITATDSSGNVSVAEVQVKAPHDRRSK